MKAGHSGKYLGLGNKSGLSGTHRHSLEKLKEYESHLLMTSVAANNSNVVLKSGTSGGVTSANREPPFVISSSQHAAGPGKQQYGVHMKTYSHQNSEKEPHVVSDGFADGDRRLANA